MQEVNKMGYNPQNAKEGNAGTQLPADTIMDGVIVSINDGHTKDFIKPEVQKIWKGDIESLAINCTVEVKNGEEMVKIEQLFTYSEEEGQTIYNAKSNLGKFKVKYGKLPVAGDQVKVITNSDGFGKIKLD